MVYVKSINYSFPGANTAVYSSLQPVWELNKCSAGSGPLAQFPRQFYLTGTFKPSNSSHEKYHLVMPVLQVVPKKSQTCIPSVVVIYSSVHQQTCFTACKYLWITYYSRGAWGQIVPAFCITDVWNKQTNKQKKAGNWWWWKLLSWQLKDGTCTVYLETTRVPKVSLTCPVPERSALGRKLFSTPETS